MAEIECQYTGIKFSASSKRAKNHPVISQILADANRVGRYGLVLDALKKARVDGVTDIDEFRSRALDALTGDIARSNAERDAERQARREADATRERANAYLRQHGYCWQKVVASWETDPQDPEADYEFLLFAPDGRRVVPTVAQALDEIERGADVVLAEIAASIQAERDRRAAIAAEKADLVARMEATGLTLRVDFSWDDFQFQVGSVIEQTEHFTAREYRLRGGEAIGFVIKDR